MDGMDTMHVLDDWVEMQPTNDGKRARPITPVSDDGANGADPMPGATLMERLDAVLQARDEREQEQERVRRDNKRLMCAVAAEGRRWAHSSSDYHHTVMPLHSLARLAEEALGAAFTKVCELMRPHYDYCALKWVPSACDHNNEPCRIKRQRPAVETWS